MKEWLKIVGFCILASVVYGIAHDQITIRICLPYFTYFHPRIIESQNPTVLALFWGIFATWWMGAIFGGLLACSSRLGTWPKLYCRQMVVPVIKLLAISAIAAVYAGIIGSQSYEWFFGNIPGATPTQFNTCLYAHNACYIVSGVGSLVLCGAILRKRYRASAVANAPDS
ncbi:MAG: hypothetical protein ABL962_01795 [Fimbriimonadaceae bacterium]